MVDVELAMTFFNKASSLLGFRYFQSYYEPEELTLHNFHFGFLIGDIQLAVYKRIR
jgi:hypothetical protein